MKYEVVCTWYEGSLSVNSERYPTEAMKNASYTFGGGMCYASMEWNAEEAGMRGKLRIRFKEQSSYPVSFSVVCTAEGWEKKNYVFAPAAVYDGNRMKSIPLSYPPFCSEPDLVKEPFIADIPHLSKENDCSAISLLAGDMSTPAIGFWSQHTLRGFLLYGMQQSGERELGYTIKEDIVNKTTAFAVGVPGVREKTCYFFGERKDGSGFYPDTHAASTDTGKYYSENDEECIEFCVYEFCAKDLMEYFQCFHRTRNCMGLSGKRKEMIPFSKAYQAIKEKYRNENFICDPFGEGYFSVGTDHFLPQQCWQAGWIGGGMNLLPFLYENGVAYRMGMVTFQFILDYLQNENGWFYGMYRNGIYYGDNFHNAENADILLIRKNADLLYFLIKEWTVLKRRNRIRTDDERKIRALADAFVRVYKKYGQIGQFLNIKTEELLIGNSAGGAMAVGALALAYTVFQEIDYLNTARQLGEYYHENYVINGMLNGGPGEIGQAPDSESAFSLLESYVQLYETDSDKKWIAFAEDTFEIAATWVMSYDFSFPKDCTAKKRQVHTKGTVFANAQNKHSAPGICTLSGNCLLKLYRITGNMRYLDCLEAISHSLVQFVSIKENPVNTLSGIPLPEGYINERVQTSDWEGKETVGEFLYGSNWPEVSMLLTYIEVPGIYVELSNKLVKCFDHVTCKSTFPSEEKAILEISNPTSYDAEVTVLTDTEGKMGHDYFGKMRKILIGAGKTETIAVEKEGRSS